jgi:hypothetical protein
MDIRIESRLASRAGVLAALITISIDIDDSSMGLPATLDLIANEEADKNLVTHFECDARGTTTLQ